MKVTLLLTLFICLSCKDENWGYKVNDFAHNEAYGIINNLSKDDLRIKWYSYFFNMSSYGLAEVNKANQQMLSLSEIDLENIENDSLKLMRAAYQLDQQIEYLYEVNEAIYNAEKALQKSLKACSDQDIFDIYTSNRSYLNSSFNMAMPQFVSAYGISITIPMDDGTGDSKGNKSSGIDSVPLIGNIFTFFSDKKAKKNKEKFEEAQTYMNKLQLDPAELRQSSNTACETNKESFNETLNIIQENIELQKVVFQKTYHSLTSLRNKLAPQVIKNILRNFSAEDRYIYAVISDTKFINRIMEMYRIAQNLNPEDDLTHFESIEKTEDKIELANSLSSELEISKNSVLGIKNLKLINSLAVMLKNKKQALTKSVQGRLQ